MKLNLGCGPYYATGWVNLEMPGTEYRCDVEANILALSGNSAVRDSLTPPNDTFPEHLTDLEAVYAGHFLEHLPLGEIPSVLLGLRRRMRPGAPIAVVGPDTGKAYDMLTRGQIPFSLYELCQAHYNPTAGHSHLWDCTEELVAHLLIASGFNDVTPVNLTRFSPYAPSPHDQVLTQFPVVSYAAWQCAVIARA